MRGERELREKGEAITRDRRRKAITCTKRRRELKQRKKRGKRENEEDEGPDATTSFLSDTTHTPRTTSGLFFPIQSYSFSVTTTSESRQED